MKEVSEKYSINLREFLKGLKLAVLGSVMGFAKNAFAQPNFDFLTAFNDWHTLVNGAILAGGLYVVAAFFEGQKTV